MTLSLKDAPSLTKLPSHFKNGNLINDASILFVVNILLSNFTFRLNESGCVSLANPITPHCGRQSSIFNLYSFFFIAPYFYYIFISIYHDMTFRLNELRETHSTACMPSQYINSVDMLPFHHSDVF